MALLAAATRDGDMKKRGGGSATEGDIDGEREDDGGAVRAEMISRALVDV
jgi:hypothetical protein